MKKLRGMWKRIAAMALSAMLLAGAVPEAAFAAGAQSAEKQTGQATVVESLGSPTVQSQEAKTTGAAGSDEVLSEGNSQTPGKGSQDANASGTEGNLESRCEGLLCIYTGRFYD